ncbi:sterol desaturase family protein [Parvularcula bermudensis HTCC2503]|uniref:Sterol desaturase family protein n=1 Tax=Parvularcula bermudensis (strain ATCC BAA-594 / HTCC2503 / KCTC 12087) TaxID=314260 RepID=E0TC00_PARBH|nr:sterol desaturase family protein [Parvularcula bermudensis]ADM09793.1 sterol desaturase family protein [Parvularcula bermudensis HTCC2503]
MIPDKVSLDLALFLPIYGWLLLIIWARYVFMAGIVHKSLWRPDATVRTGSALTGRAPGAAAMWREAKTSIGVSLIYALPAAVLFFLFEQGGTALTREIGGLGDLFWQPVALILYLVLHDTYFYWTHRAMHHPRLYKATHHTHHMSKQPTAWASFCFSPAEALIGAVIVPALAFVIPIHVATFLLLLSLMTFSAVMNHAGVEVWPRRFLDGPIGRHLITARHHNLHHTKFQRNFGLYFRWWDRLMGTDSLEGDPVSEAGRDKMAVRVPANAPL